MVGRSKMKKGFSINPKSWIQRTHREGRRRSRDIPDATSEKFFESPESSEGRPRSMSASTLEERTKAFHKDKEAKSEDLEKEKMNENKLMEEQTSMKSYEEEFHKVFKTNDPLKLAEKCKCGSKNGKVFLTSSHIYFYSHFPVLKHEIPFKNIISIQRRSTSRYLYWSDSMSIEVTTLKHVYNFTGMNERDKLFKEMKQTFHSTENSSLPSVIKQKNSDQLKKLLESDRTDALEMEKLDNEGEAPIHRAILSHDPQIVECILEYYKKNEKDINMKDNSGWTPLHLAVYYNDGQHSEDIVLKSLLEFPGISVDIENNDGNTPLHYFCEKFLSPSCQELGQDLIKKGATVNKTNFFGETPLHKAIFNRAVRLMMVELLVSNGADVNSPNSKFGETALHYAVRLDRRDLVKLLIEAGAEVEFKSKEGKTPYDLAVDGGKPKIAKLLKRVLDLIDWLKVLELGELKKTFIKEELYLDTLSDLSDDMIQATIDSLNVNAGSRIKLKKAMLKLRASHDFDDMEVKIKKANKAAKIAQLTPAPQVSSEAFNVLANAIDSTGWLIDETDLEYTRKLGSGGSGKVYKGLYKGQKVAIKVLKTNNTVPEDVYKEFQKEFQIMSICKSPHIIQFYGACIRPKVCMVMELASMGSLFDVLNAPHLEIGWKMGFKFAIEMAAGMNYLHHTCEPPIVHRDLKSLNILITDDFSVKLTDFGLSRVNTASNMETFKKLVGTLGWTDPALIRGGEFTTKSDVYSAALILFEIVARVVKGKYERPYEEYSDLKEFQIVGQAVEKNLRPTLPPCHPGWKKIITRSWCGNPEERPTFKELLSQLKDLHQEYCDNPGSFEVAERSEKVAVSTEGNSDNA